jgi:cell division protease FtsH
VLPEKETYHMQRRRLLGQLAWAFGGRAAEEEFCGDISAGAADDIKRATEVARAMVTELGMSDRIGPISYAERQGSDFLGTELSRGRDHSDETARQIDEEVRRLLTEAYARAQEIVRAKREPIEAITQALLAYETISGDEIEKLMRGVPPQDLRPGSTPPTPPTEPRKAPTQSPSTPTAGEGRPGELPGLSPA